MAITGGCLCGGVRYELTAEPMMSAYCHCSRCRKSGGGNALAVLILPTEGLQITQGRDLIREYKTEGLSNRAFCSVCGGSLFGGTWPDGPITGVAMGSLDGDPGIRPRAHIHVASMAPWDAITDNLRQFDALPG